MINRVYRFFVLTYHGSFCAKFAAYIKTIAIKQKSTATVLSRL